MTFIATNTVVHVPPIAKCGIVASAVRIPPVAAVRDTFSFVCIAATPSGSSYPIIVGCTCATTEKQIKKRIEKILKIFLLPFYCLINQLTNQIHLVKQMISNYNTPLSSFHPIISCMFVMEIFCAFCGIWQ